MNKHREIAEFNLIKHYFSALTPARSDVQLGIGDDAALLKVPQDRVLAVSIDTLVSGVHFYSDVSPESLGHKALAVNLSDLAAMGAQPAWVTLALTLPEIDEPWLSAFCRGFAKLATDHGVQLVGGDTTLGPLSITVQVHGFLPAGEGLRRSGAQVGDDIYVTGCLGDAALALHHIESRGAFDVLDIGYLKRRLERPEPRVEVGLALRQMATSAIDISDGLLGDLIHILQSSGVGACLELEKLPLSRSVADSLLKEDDWTRVVAGGDDYELCFTLPEVDRIQIGELANRLGLPITRIGYIEQKAGLRCFTRDGTLWVPERSGYQHFAS